MAEILYFAWVDPTDTTFLPAYAREDEDVFDVKFNHGESEYPTATVLIRNPNVGLLAPTRKQWAWISYANGDTSGLTPLFFGRVAGQAVSMSEKVIQIILRARPIDMQEQKEAVASALRVRPYWDPVWIRPDRRNDPETVLESRTAAWHFDRQTSIVTTSDIIYGEDGTETFTQDDYFEGSLSVSIGEQPLSNVYVTADVSWAQRAIGEVDLTDTINAIFTAAGSRYPYLISSFTGQGLWENWPESDSDIGSGWFVKSTTLFRADGVQVPLEYSKTKCKYKEEPDPDDKSPAKDFKLRMALWQIRQTFIAGYDVERQRRETVNFTMSADVQPLWTDEADAESEYLTFSSNEVGELIDDEETTSATRPIVDLRRPQFFTTDRGHQAIEYTMTVARARLLSRSRAVQVSIAIPFERAIALSCRMNAIIESDELAGGQASGKIVSYEFGIEEGGKTYGAMTIACCVGKGNTVTASPGTSDYDDDYSEDGWSEETAGTYPVITDEITYTQPSDPPLDDGVDFFNMTAANNVLLAEMMQGGESDQRAILAQKYRLVADAVTTLNDAYTRWRILLRPLTIDEPFEQTYNVSVSQVMIPKTFDLESL